jgi:hypothetical protein
LASNGIITINNTYNLTVDSAPFNSVITVNSPFSGAETFNVNWILEGILSGTNAIATLSPTGMLRWGRGSVTNPNPGIYSWTIPSNTVALRISASSGGGGSGSASNDFGSGYFTNGADGEAGDSTFILTYSLTGGGAGEGGPSPSLAGYGQVGTSGANGISLPSSPLVPLFPSSNGGTSPLTTIYNRGGNGGAGVAVTFTLVNDGSINTLPPNNITFNIGRGGDGGIQTGQYYGTVNGQRGESGYIVIEYWVR